MRINITNHKAFEHYRLKEDALDVLKEALDILKDHKPWIAAGTALGIYRDGKLLDNDTDLDIAMIGGAWATPEYILGLFPESVLLRTGEKEGMFMQIAIGYKDTLIDLFLHYKDDRFINHYTVYSAEGTQIMPCEIYENLTDVQGLPFPSPPEDYLTRKFGGDWKIPQNKKAIYVER